MHLAQQDRAHRLQRFVGNAGQRRIVGHLLAAIDVPVSVGGRLRFGSGGHCVQQRLHAMLGIDLAEVSAMGAQFAKQRFVVRSRALADDRNTETRRCRRLGRHSCLQTVGIIYRRLAKGIQLMGAPQMRRELLDKLGGRVYPIKFFKLPRRTYLGESLKPFFCLFRGERAQVRQFLFDRLALGRKLEIVINDLAQQAGHEGQRQPLQRCNVIRRQLSGLWRIVLELLRLEIAWKHKRYNNSGIGLPCAREAEKSSMDPRVGTRSVDSVARS